MTEDILRDEDVTKFDLCDEVIVTRLQGDEDYQQREKTREMKH